MTPHAPSTSRPGLRRAAALVLVALALVVASCANRSDAGDGFRLRADQLTAPTTTAPAAEPTGTVVATATVPELQVFAEKPTLAFGATPEATPSAFRQGGTAPIPRFGLNSAGARKTEAGWAYTNPTYWGQPLVLRVIETDGEWVKVMIPARPNGQEGWVRADEVSLGESQFRMELTLSEFMLRVYDGDAVVVETPVVIGKDSTPTPVGEFFLTEVLSAEVAGVSPGGAYGPFILPTNGYSETLDLFDNGLPVVAFHGTNQPQLLGSKASNGCIRMPNEVVTQLAELLPPGTPITIKD